MSKKNNNRPRDAKQPVPPEEDAPELLAFTDQDGNVVKFQICDCIEYEGRDYAVLLPEEGSEEDNGMVYIFEVVEELDSDTDTYVGVEDQSVIDAVYEIFAANHKDEFDFES